MTEHKKSIFKVLQRNSPILGNLPRFPVSLFVTLFIEFRMVAIGVVFIVDKDPVKYRSEA